MEPIFGTMRTGALGDRATVDELRGPMWEQRTRGVWRPAGMAVGPADGRVADAVALLTGGSALGGWASLRYQGSAGFDGRGFDDQLRPVLIHCASGTQLRRRSVVEPCRAEVWDHEITDFAGVRVTTMARAVYDEMRLAPTLRHAVVALDLAISRVSKSPRTSLSAVASVVASHHKTRGIVQARRALALGSERSASPLETRTRLVAHLDADVAGLSVNAPIFDRFGNLLGIADLLDEDSGLVIETDGAHHREAQNHTDDNVREEKFERSGLVVVRVTSLDLRDVPRLAHRIVMGRRDARAAVRRDWTLQEPDWWSSWEPGRRWR